tara:strand:- start:819 stop:956 length:138 start_codon:yes stop_codon:yes gene_type:complete
MLDCPFDSLFETHVMNKFADFVNKRIVVVQIERVALMLETPQGLA